MDVTAVITLFVGLSAIALSIGAAQFLPLATSKAVGYVKLFISGG